MGRHTRKPELGSEANPGGDRSGRNRRLGKVPLLPTVAGILAIGAVVSAVSTKQISLNFAGGAPSDGPPPIVTVSSQPEAKKSGRTARDDSAQSGRAGRGATRSGVAVVFRTISASGAGFQSQATITNRRRTAIKGWTLVVRYPRAEIVSVSGGTVVRRGTVLIVRNPATRPTIAPGGNVRLRFTARGTAGTVSACAFNGNAC